jgi:hypothetical protein
MSMMVINPFVFGVAGLTLTQVLSATSTANTITWPATLAAGDLAVMVDSGDSTSNGVPPTTVVPSGFTSIVNTANATSHRQICSYKILTGSESGSLTGMDGVDNDRKAMVIFRGSSPIASVTVGSALGQQTTGNPTAQVPAASGGTPPLIVFGAYSAANGGTPVDPRSFTPAKDGEVSPNTSCYLAWKIYNSAPADVTIDMDDEGAMNILQSFYLQVT